MLEIAEFIGTLTFALSGYFVGVKERLDFLGIFITSFLTALGGGVLRDMIVGRKPLSFVDPTFPTIVLVVIMIATILQLHKNSSLENKSYFIISDTFGLVSFSISGTLVAVKADFSIFGVFLIALITAVGGGVLRDMLINRVPLLLKSDFYGSVAIVVAIMIYLLFRFDLDSFFWISLVFIFGVGLRLIAYYQKWHLPKLT